MAGVEAGSSSVADISGLRLNSNRPDDVQISADADLISPGLLLATVTESGALYTTVANRLNDGREDDDKFSIVPEDELLDRVEDWLSEERLKAIETGLVYDEANPVLLLALPNVEIGYEEIVQTWASARSGKLWEWGGRIAFLQQWPAGKLSGYNASSTDDSSVRFVAIETGYDSDRSGPREKQLAELRGVQADYPEVETASIFEGGVLANRYSNNPNPRWPDAYVRAIEVPEDGDGRIPNAGVNSDGKAYVDDSRLGRHGVARRLVR